MKELSHAEIELVSGAGCVQDTITDLGKNSVTGVLNCSGLI